MASIFQCDRSNGVVRVPIDADCAATGAVITVENFDGTNPGGRSMNRIPITGYSLELSTNHQFLHSLDEFIYAFSFGDRVGELTVTGVAFTIAEPCEITDETVKSINQDIGQENVYEYYLAHRFSRAQTATRIAIGTSEVQLIGFLTGVRMEVPSPALPIMQWALRFSVILAIPPSVASTAGSDAPFRPPLSDIGLVGG